MRHLVLLGLLCAATAVPASGMAAGPYHVRPAADVATGGDGLTWRTALKGLPASFVRDATYYLAAGSYGAVNLTTPVSTTQVITFKKVTVADHGSADGWQDDYATAGPAVFANVAIATDYWTFDGVTGGGPGSWETGHGIKINAGGHTIQLDNGASHIKFLHVDAANNGRLTADMNEDILYAIYGSKDVTVSYSYWHDVSICHLLTIGSDAFVIEYSKLARNGPIDDVNHNHREAWSAQADSNVVIRYSIFEDISNSAIIGLVNGSGTAANWQIYGNVFWRTGNVANVATAAAIDVEHTGLTASNWEIYNNVVANLEGSQAAFNFLTGAPSGNYVYNNIFYKNHVNAVGYNGATGDYNWYVDNYRTEGCESNPGGICDLDLKADDEAHGQTSAGSPFVDFANGNFALTGPSSPGKVLAAPYDKDWTGQARGGDGVWDRGALEYGPGGTTRTPEAPTNLTVQ